MSKKKLKRKYKTLVQFYRDTIPCTIIRYKALELPHTPPVEGRPYSIPELVVQTILYSNRVYRLVE
jgi:hypothetical protein